MNVTVALFMLLERPLWRIKGPVLALRRIRLMWLGDCGRRTTPPPSFSPDFPFNSPPSEMKITLTGLWRSLVASRGEGQEPEEEEEE